MIKDVFKSRSVIANLRFWLFGGLRRSRRLRKIWTNLVWGWTPKSELAKGFLDNALDPKYVLKKLPGHNARIAIALPAFFQPPKFVLKHALISSPDRYWSHELYRHEDTGLAPRLHYVRNAADADHLCKMLFLRPEIKAVGLDAEFAQTTAGVGKDQVALLQIASETDIAVIHVAAFQNEVNGIYALTPAIKSILESRTLLKVGSAVDTADAKMLARSFNATSRGLVELGEYDRRLRATALKWEQEGKHLHEAIKPLTKDLIFHGTKPQISLRGLATLTQYYLGLPLDKSYRSESWALDYLPDAAIQYAANDAYASLMVFLALEQLRAEHFARFGRPHPTEVIPALHGTFIKHQMKLPPPPEELRRSAKAVRRIIQAPVNSVQKRPKRGERPIAQILEDELINLRSALASTNKNLDAVSICPPQILSWLVRERPLLDPTPIGILNLKGRWILAQATPGAEFAVKFVLMVKQTLAKICRGELQPTWPPQQRLLEILRHRRLHLSHVLLKAPEDVLPDGALVALVEGRSLREVASMKDVNGAVLQGFIDLRMTWSSNPENEI